MIKRQRLRRPSKRPGTPKYRPANRLQRLANLAECFRQRREVYRVINDQQVLETFLVEKPSEDAVLRVHAFGYRRILDALNVQPRRYNR